MNKYFTVVLMLCIASGGIFAENSANSLVEDNPSADVQCGVILELTGNVYLKPAGSSVFTAAKAGDAIAPNTVVSTGFKSTAVIASGCSVITVRPLTRLSLSENTNVNLQTGRVKIDASAGTTANCTIQSSYAAASVQGTDIEFDTVNIKVNEGTLAFYGISGPAVMVKTGGKSSIGADGKPSDTALTSLLPSAPTGGVPSSGGKASSGGGGAGGGNVPSCCQ